MPWTTAAPLGSRASPTLRCGLQHHPFSTKMVLRDQVGFPSPVPDHPQLTQRESKCLDTGATEATMPPLRQTLKGLADPWQSSFPLSLLLSPQHILLSDGHKWPVHLFIHPTCVECAAMLGHRAQHWGNNGEQEACGFSPSKARPMWETRM